MSIRSTVADRAILRANPQLADASWAAVERFSATAACLGVVTIVLAMLAGIADDRMQLGVIAGTWLCIALLVYAIAEMQKVTKRLLAGWVIVGRQCVPAHVLLDAGVVGKDLRLLRGLHVSPRPHLTQWALAALAAIVLPVWFGGTVLLISGYAEPDIVAIALPLLGAFVFFLVALRLTLGINPAPPVSGADPDDAASEAAEKWLRKRLVLLAKHNGKRRSRQRRVDRGR